ncbi:MAG: hypothetical protein COB16_09865 [Rhodobacteraceae bacterium]|nr:MAG: hypothetical protein COB16_09865 [Paracoccaceae bacterium]
MERNGKSLTDLCAVSAREMSHLQAQVQRLEDVVFTILESDTKPTSKDRQALQDFDVIVQTLAGLAGFFQRLQLQSADNGDTDVMQASEAITLQKLRERLRDTAEVITF